MVASQSIPQQHKKTERSIATEELVNRMAADLRARSDPDFPHSFYVAQVRRQLAGKPSQMPATNDLPKGPIAPTHSSVFHAWALAE
ncbi:hypothetical protein J2T09_004757 [Neorhizobium huautlense]|uniref:Uncharacterized protein n=1 Tax=Neorhizobium huautlense TaxID=67774 RepID=A0ABT9PZV3_9HYPH|nr:hypothetical protein [Neorhizobium huautlense]MDP9839977.1 hypothetical protein [Neorhizobium huautlense]